MISDVGAEIHGKWQGEKTEAVGDTEGITVTANGNSEVFGWDEIVNSAHWLSF